MKKIVFLIIASVLVIGLVLPGCCPPYDQCITIGIIGPMTFIQGRDQWAGAEMARDEINSPLNGGVHVGSKDYGILLKMIDSNEVCDGSGADGTAALSAVIDDVDFIVGGFRTEAVAVYREVAMSAKKIFIGCGAASNELQQSVLDSYAQYKYWFRGTPCNNSFLFTSMLKQLKSINSQLRAAANMTDLDPDTTVACIVDDAAWADAFATKLPIYLGALGFNMCGPCQQTHICQLDLTTELTAIENACGDDPMITVTVLAGPAGKAYGMQQPTYLPSTFSTGINVEAQDIDYHHDTGAEYHTLVDTWAENVALTPYTLDWFDDYMGGTGRYPIYTAATYDAIYALKAAIEDVGLSTDAIITWLEDLNNAWTGVGGTTGYYPMPDINLGSGVFALSAEQAYEIYPHLPAYYGYSNYAEMAANWAAHRNDWTTDGGFLPHDLIYGPGWQTGIGAQWQPIDPAHPELDWHKVGWWPYIAVPGVGENKPAKDLTPTEVATLKAAGLLDQYGNWNMEYPGTVDLVVP